jgi:hypothetical protein
MEFNRGLKNIPHECYFLPKASADPALEVADFIMHAVGRLARQNLEQRGNFVPDFRAIFHAVEPRLISFMEVGSVAEAIAAHSSAALSYR